jgi:hypothetical protein
MTSITKKQIQNAADTVDSFDKSAAEQFMHDFSEKQPSLVGYLLASSENANLPDEMIDEILYMGAVIWQAYINAFSSIETIKEETIENIENKLVDDLQSVEDQQEQANEHEIIESMNTIFRKSQPEISDFIMQSILGESEEDLEEPMHQMSMISILQVENEALNAQANSDSPLHIV